MRKWRCLGCKAFAAATFGVAGLFVAGCGPITAATVMKQGAMWAGKQVIKKEYKEYKARKHEKSDRDSHGHGHSADQSRREHSGS